MGTCWIRIAKEGSTWGWTCENHRQAEGGFGFQNQAWDSANGHESERNDWRFPLWVETEQTDGTWQRIGTVDRGALTSAMKAQEFADQGASLARRERIGGPTPGARVRVRYVRTEKDGTVKDLAVSAVYTA